MAGFLSQRGIYRASSRKRNNVHPSAPPKFTVLVAHFDGTSERPIRSGFVLQQVRLANGVGRVGGPLQSQPTVDATHYQAAIKVLSPTFWDPSVAAPPPFYAKEEIQIFDEYFVAGEEFGAGHGSAAGTVDQIASQLATSINTIEGVSAVAVTDTVYIASHRFDGSMAVKASNDTAVQLAGYVFRVLGASGVVLTTPPVDRRTFYVVKTVKSQSSPVILP